MKNKDKILLIDGQGMIYRSFYALPPLKNSHGMMVNAVYGFTMMLIKLLEQEKPEFITIALDLPAPTFRHIKYKAYKANRKKMPKELVDQIPIIKKVIRNYDISICEKEGYEADDIIGTLSKDAESKGLETLIVTGDRDAFQLITGKTKVMMLIKGITETKLVKREDIEEKYCVAPENMVDILALKGDASDNIPGVPGIGEKTAISLIKKYGSIHNILENPDMITNTSLREKIKEHKELIIMSKELATIDRNVPFVYDLKSFKAKVPNYDGLWTIFKEYELGNLLKRIKPYITRKKNTISYQMIDTEDKLNDLIKMIKEQHAFSYYLLKSPNNNINVKPLGIAMSFKNEVNVYIPFFPISLLEANHCLSSEKVFRYLGPFFKNKKISKAGFNIKDDYILLKKYEIEMNQNIHDIMISAYLLHPSKGKYSLEDIVWEFLNFTKEESKKNNNEKMKEACENARNIFKLKKILEDRLTENKMLHLFKEVEMPLVGILGDMEILGFKVDEYVLKKMSQNLNKQLKELKNTIWFQAGTEFNINSPKQLSLILFEKLKLPIIKKTKTGYSTNSDVLNALTSEHEIISHVIKYRELEKLKNTYVDKLPLLIDKNTHRIHTSFHQTITATGRLSSSEPNLQNIPIRTEIGRSIRKAFISEKDFLLLSADYSQIELRILAHLSEDKRLMAAFRENEDIHAHTASSIFGIDRKLVSREMRRMAKIINFGIIYGMSSYGLARNLGISRLEAEKFILQYFTVYQGVKEYIELKKEEAREKGYVLTLLNRRRYVPEINSSNRNIREFNERIAINAPIQGTAADLIKIAMISIAHAFKKNNFQSKMLLQVHDELIFEIEKKELIKTKEMIKKIMESSLKLSLPLKINIKTGENWADINE